MMTDYIRNTWYPLTWSRNLDNQISKHRVTEQDIVTYRDSNGQIVNLEDMCPHRMAQMSNGTLQGTAIQCVYHYLQFNCNDKRLLIPVLDQ